MTDDLIKHAKSGAPGQRRHLASIGVHDVAITLLVPGATMTRAIQVAKRREQDPVDMIVQIITHAVHDDMVDAIIDDGRGA